MSHDAAHQLRVVQCTVRGPRCQGISSAQAARPPAQTTIKVGSAAQTGECNQLGWNQQNGESGQPGRSRCVRETVRARNATWIVLWSRKPIPLERMDGSPASADNSKGLGARPATDVLPGIGLALGGWASRALQSERPGSASAKQHIERRKEKSSSAKTQQLGNPVKTHEFDQPISKKKLCRSVRLQGKVVPDSERGGHQGCR